MIKKMTALVILAALLAVGLGTVQAAPGGESDPFLTLSYVTNVYRPETEQAILQRTQAAAAQLEQILTDKLDGLAESYLTQAGSQEYAGVFTRKVLSRGDRLDLPAGSSVVFEGGRGELTFVSGALVDVTEGVLVTEGGVLLPSHRYAAAENTACSFTAVTDAVILSVRGRYGLEETGQVQTPFTDLASTDWFYSSVRYAYEEGLYQGITPTVFNPDESMTRAMLAMVLSRLAGAEDEAPGAGFTDVLDSAWYAGAVNWAASTGVVSGMGNNQFEPDSAVTREQMAVMLCRYAQEYRGLDISAAGDLSQFSDRADISLWAEQAVSWAVGAGILNGYDDSTLSPGGTATRAEVAAMLQRFSALLP